MFWGLILKANKQYSQKVSKAFHVSQASLDIANSGDDSVQLILKWGGNDYILCNLRRGGVEQVPLDLNFSEGDEISFTSQGKGSIHLVGYFIIDPEDFDVESSSDGEEAELDESKSNVSNKSSDKKTVDQVEEEESDESGEEDEEETSESEEEEEEEEEPTPKKAKKAKLPNETKENGVHANNLKQKGGMKKLQGGVKIEDIKVGGGQEARNGSKVQVYYEGRLESNNKVFDSSKKGGGFRFILGRGEVIKGWDVGVNGMKVGGKRKIICPPGMAYGNRGSPPVIPPNSTLVFDVELKSVQ